MTVLRCLLLVGPLLASQARAQQEGTPDSVTPALRNGPAATLCRDGQAATEWSSPLEPAIRAQLDVHEAVHRGQLAETCDTTLRIILAYPLLLADAEAEAGCAQFVATPIAPVNVGLEYGKLRGWLYDRAPSLPHELLDAMLARYCGIRRVI